MSSKRSPYFWPLIIFCGSFIIHSLALYALNGFSFEREMKPVKKEPIWVDLKPVTLPKPIADIQKPKVQKKPKKASVQSKYDQTVKEEQVAVSQPKLAMAPKGNSNEKAPPKKAQKPTQEKKKPEKKQKKEKKDNKKSESKKPESPKEVPLKVPAKKDPEPKKTEKVEAKLPDPISVSPSAPSVARIPGIPEAMDIRQPGGVFFPQEYIPNYKVGGRTYLNAMANPQISYFVELKHKFRLAFNPNVLARYIREIQNKAEVRVTLGLSIGADGQVKNIVIIRDSGLPGYNQESVRTVRVSAPFLGS